MESKRQEKLTKNINKSEKQQKKLWTDETFNQSILILTVIQYSFTIWTLIVVA